MKKKYAHSQFLEDVKMFVVWKTAKLIKEHFTNDIQSFYDTFYVWKKMRNGEHLQQDSFDSVWKKMRMLNEFLAVDKHTSRRLTYSKTPSVFFQELVEKHDIIFLDKGRLCWRDADGTMKTQHFGYRYFASRDLLQTLVSQHKTLEKIIDFKNGLYSKRLMKLIAKLSNEAKENRKTEKTTMKIQTPDDDIDFSDVKKETKPSKKANAQRCKFISKVQQWLDSKKLGIETARAMLADIGLVANAKALVEPRDGVCAAELDYVTQTKIIQQYLLAFKDDLDGKNLAKWCKAFAVNYNAYFKGADNEH